MDSKDQQIESTHDNVLGQRFILAPLLRFATPTIIMMIFMGIYTTVDAILVSRFVNTNALSSINIVTPVISLIVGLGTMLATGGNAIVARKIGQGDQESACRDFSQLIYSGALIGVLITVLGILFIRPVILGLGSSDVLYDYCKDYLGVLLLFTPANILQVLFQSLFVTAGKPRLGMFTIFAAGATNILLDYLFIVILNIGVVGAALGTGLAYLVPSLIGIAFFARNKNGLHFKRFRFRFGLIVNSSKNGASGMVGQVAMSVTTLYFNLTMMNLLGEDGVAAVTIMIFSQFLLTTLFIGYSMGVAPVISYKYGEDNKIQMKEVTKYSYVFIAVMSVSVFVAIMIYHPALIGVFADRGTAVYEIAAQGFPIFIISFLFSGLNIFVAAYFTAMSNGKIAALITFFRTFGLIVAGLFILPRFAGVPGVWMVVPIAEFLTIGVCMICIVSKHDRVSK